MTDREDPAPWHASRGYRLASGGLGAVLAGAGLYVLLGIRPLEATHLLASAALVAVGLNLAVSALTGRESWLSRIGPLP